jgi:hypothetical protein
MWSGALDWVSGINPSSAPIAAVNSPATVLGDNSGDHQAVNGQEVFTSADYPLNLYKASKQVFLPLIRVGR